MLEIGVSSTPTDGNTAGDPVFIFFWFPYYDLNQQNAGVHFYCDSEDPMYSRIYHGW